jgi:hypothetical protein
MKEYSDVANDPEPSSSANPHELPAPSQSHWIKRALACNPFYLVSAALLLYGFYLISVDPNFLQREISQLLFNFTALQFYELLVVITAVLLVRRQIWYDSTLLVGLENLLVLVPFILISQAALIEIHWVWGMCLLAGLAALVRSDTLKRFFAELNFPTRLTQIGILVLLANVLLPVVYRFLHEYKVGKLPTTGAAYLTNEFAWLLLLPALFTLGNFVPAKPGKNDLLPQGFWIPAALFCCWMIGTVVHLYCLGYVYDFPLRRELVAPATWALFWTLFYRVRDFVQDIKSLQERAMLLLPSAATLFGVSQAGNEVFVSLTLLNVAIYGATWVMREDRFARHLLLISGLALIAGLPEDWGRSVLPEFTSSKAIGVSVAFYFVLRAAVSRNPKLGLIGALVLGFMVMCILGNSAAPNWGTQIGLAFLLIHSLRWADNQHEGTGAVRLLAAIGWVAHTFWCMYDGGAAWMTCTVAGPVLAIYLVAHWLAGKWGSPIIPISAGIVMLSWPGDTAVGTLHSTPVGLLAVLGSFVLFAAGTFAALTKHRWLH